MSEAAASEIFAYPCPHCERVYTDLATHLLTPCGRPKIEADWVGLPALTSERWGSIFWVRAGKKGPDECWLWTAALKESGYGAASIPKPLSHIKRMLGLGQKANQAQAHRVAWVLTHGAIPRGVWVLHRCDAPACCNPAHLYLGDHHDNQNDIVVRKRRIGTYRGRPARAR